MDDVVKELQVDDRKILTELQENARLTNAELAEKTGTSTSSCWRRTRNLEDSGVIRGYHAEVDRRLIGLGVMAFVSIRINSHSDKEAHSFANSLTFYPEVIACHSVAGSFDFMLQVVTTDLDAYEDFAMKRLRRLPGIREMTTSIVLKEIKPNSVVPLNF